MGGQTYLAEVKEFFVGQSIVFGLISAARSSAEEQHASRAALLSR
jgi:hypothetical protein